MDDGDDSYVPQISQMDIDHYGFATDLSADSYVPPPPQPGQEQYMHHQQQMPPYFQQQQHESAQQMMNVREKQAAAPKATKTRKRAGTNKKNSAAANANEMNPGPGMMAPGAPRPPMNTPSQYGTQNYPGFGGGMPGPPQQYAAQAQQGWSQGQQPSMQSRDYSQQGGYYNPQHPYPQQLQQMQQTSPSYGYRQPMSQQQAYPQRYQAPSGYTGSQYQSQAQGGYYPQSGVHSGYSAQSGQAPAGYEQQGGYGQPQTGQGQMPVPGQYSQTHAAYQQQQQMQRSQPYPQQQQQQQAYQTQMTGNHPMMMPQHRMPTPTPLPAHPPTPNAEMRPPSQQSAGSGYPNLGVTQGQAPVGYQRDSPQMIEMMRLRSEMHHLQAMPPSQQNQQALHNMNQKVQYLQSQLQQQQHQQQQSYHAAYPQGQMTPGRSPMPSQQMASPIPGSTQQISPRSQSSNPATPAQAVQMPSIQVSTASQSSLMGPSPGDPTNPPNQYLPPAPVVSSQSLTPPPPPPGPSNSSSMSMAGGNSTVNNNNVTNNSYAAPTPIVSAAPSMGGHMGPAMGPMGGPPVTMGMGMPHHGGPPNVSMGHVPPARPLETEGMAVTVGRPQDSSNGGGQPRVEVNIRPPANSETLITVYGYRNSAPTTVSSAPSAPPSISMAPSIDSLQHIPPEPMPPKISHPPILPPPVPMQRPAPPPIPGSLFGLPPGPGPSTSSMTTCIPPLPPFHRPPEVGSVLVNPQTGIPIPAPAPASVVSETGPSVPAAFFGPSGPSLPVGPVETKKEEPAAAPEIPAPVVPPVIAPSLSETLSPVTKPVINLDQFEPIPKTELTTPLKEESSPLKRKRGFGSGASAKKAAKKAKLAEIDGETPLAETLVTAETVAEPAPEKAVKSPKKRAKKLKEEVESGAETTPAKPKRQRNRKKKPVENLESELDSSVNDIAPGAAEPSDPSAEEGVEGGSREGQEGIEDSAAPKELGNIELSEPSAANTPTPTLEKSKLPNFSTKKGVRKPRKKKRPSYESDGNEGDDNERTNEDIVDIPEDLLDKRRSARKTAGGRKKYKDEWDEVNLSGDEHVMPSTAKKKAQKPADADVDVSADATNDTNPASDDAPAEVVVTPLVNDKDTLVVEKILAERAHAVKDEETGEMIEEEQFYVKFKNFSYLHCAWKNAADLEEGDRRIPQKLKRFKIKRESATTFLDEQYDEDEPFNPDFIQCERVLDVQYMQPYPLHEKGKAKEVKKEKKVEVEEKEVKEEEKGEEKEGEKEGENEKGEDEKKEEEEEEESNRLFLVKWRSLQYDECTWEEEKDVDKDKIELFFQRKDPPPAKKKEKARPTAGDWEKVDENPDFKNGNKLREYQLEGLNWLTFCWYNKQNCILADEMGLGKTIQTITFLVKLVEYGIRGPFLVVAPLSTIQNWQREFEEWSDINAVVYHGNAKSRDMIHEYEFNYKNKNGDRIAKMCKFDVLITTYEMIIADVEELRAIPFRVCVIDEAHRLKNRNCKLLSGFNQFKMETRVLLTGTPLQNNVDELFSLLNFLEPKRFSSSEVFLSEFGSCQTDEQVNKLQEILKPMMLRRLKEDVEKNLAPKEETIIEVELTNMQKKYYRAILERNFSHLAKGTSAPSLMNTMMELRKCCNHPFLINGAEDNILIEYKDTHASMNHEEQFQHALIHSSGKMVLIDKLLPRLRQNGHKILIFSQMVRVLDLIEEYLINRKYPFERIDGNVRGDLRQTAIDRFSKPDSDRFVFLLCTRAGGLGINLTAADTCIIYDSDWNPQNDLQAQARCHRIGQEKHVKIYRLITRNTYEREMFDKASLKLGLDKAVLQSMGTKENMAAQLSKKEVEELLKKGAYGALMDEETNEGDKFCEEDIDQILQRRAHTVTVEAGIKGSKFAKASFNVSSNRSDIDINDKDFWQKWAKKANVDMDTDPTRELIIYEPRTRKRRFGDDDMVQHFSGDSDQSDSDESHRTKKGRKRGHGFGEDTDYAPDELAFSKQDYFKVEKYLSLYGWGRWKEILSACELKQEITPVDIEHMCRTVLLHCIREYSGDEKMKEFTWTLITPHNAQLFDKERKGGASSKKSRKNTRQSTTTRGQEKSDAIMDVYHQGWAALPAYNPPVLAVDFSYKRHLQRHANKLLLRLRMLHFLYHDVVTVPLAEEILNGKHAKECNINIPWHPELPVYWWDREADKSLLVGIFKHGYENVHLWRMDGALCFLSWCGPIEGMSEEDMKEKEKEEDTGDDDGDQKDGEEGDEENGASKKRKGGSSKKKSGKEEKREQLLLQAQMAQTPAGFLPFPTLTECNARFRRLMTLLQRTTNVKQTKEDIKQQKKYARQEHIQTILQEREVRKLEERQRWTRREEMDFYKTIVSFGIEGRQNGEALWGRFKRIARLECKFDSTMTDYYTAFQAMCKRIQRKPLTEIEERLSHLPESLSEERVNKVNQRVDFMNRVRTVLKHNHLLERIHLCRKTNDLPIWWEAGKHDLDLLRAVAKHGVSRSEDAIVQDPEFSFLEIWEKIQKGELHIDPTPLNAKASKVVMKKEEEKLKDMKTESFEDLEKKEELVRKLLTNEIMGENATETSEEFKFGDLEPSKEKEEKKEEGEKSERKEGEKDSETTKEEKNEKKEDKEKTADEEPMDLKKEGVAVEKEKEKLEDKKEDTKDSKESSTAPQLAPMNHTTTALNWPKERMMIYRLQNICYVVEHGEYPTATALKTGYLNVATPGAASQAGSEDFRSLTPDTPSETPYSLGEESRGDSPFLGANQFAKSQVLEAMQRSGTPKIRRGRKPKSQTPNPSTNTFQELMEVEKERMRALMHQSFLQQLEQNPLAGLAMPFPFGIGGQEQTPGPSKAAKDDVLNLCTKAKTDKVKPSTSATKMSKQSEMEQALQSAQAAEIMAMSALGQDTRVPVLNLRDGTRRSGKDAPTLKNLAQWLSQHPDYIIDAPPLPFTAEAPNLEPGEIPRTSSKASSSAPKETTSNITDSERVNVINRKNGIKLSGSKAPQLKNLVMWLEKNPEWDVDPECSKLLKKIKMPSKLANRIHTIGQDKPGYPSASTSNNAPTPPANIAATSSASDPFANLFPSQMDSAAMMQMQMMLAAGGNNPFANPFMGLAGMGSFGFPPELAAMAGLTSPGGSLAGLTSPHVEQESARKEEKKAKEERERAKSKTSSQPSVSQQQQNLFGSDQSAALAAAAAGLDPSFNPFLLASLMPQTSAATSQPDMNALFGMNPFLAASGLMPGLPPNMAAMTQLQSLMGLQGMEGLLGIASSAAPLGSAGLPTTSTTQATKSRQPTTTPSSSRSRERTSGSKGASGKLSALVSKLAEQATKEQPQNKD